ncbi:MAG: RNA-binding S4 domain-containing protein [Roseovarius sp.]
MQQEGAGKTRLDKWLWQARFFRTRGLSARQVAGGHVRVNGHKVLKPAHGVGPGDVLTFAQAQRVRVVRILALAVRRGPAPEARALYEDLAPPEDIAPGAAGASAAPMPAPAPRYEGKGRPTKRARRKLDLRRSDTLE